MSFSINQVRHLFVANDPKVSAVGASLSDLGDTNVCGVTGDTLYFQHYGHGGLVCSDKISVKNILSMKITEASTLNTPLYKHTVTVSNAIAGQVYTIKVAVRYFMGIGEQDTVTKVASYFAPTGATAASIAKGLRVALRAALGFQVADTVASEANSTAAGNIENYREQLFTVTGSSTAIVVSEYAPSMWQPDKFPAGHIIRIPENGVFLAPITDSSGISVTDWASVAFASNGNAADANKKLADLERFCAGARGDEYRTMGYPYNFDTQYEINLGATYDVIDIHYAYVGSNESVQKSEKDLTILVPHASTEDFAGLIDTVTGFAGGDPRRLVPPSSDDDNQQSGETTPDNTQQPGG